MVELVDDTYDGRRVVAVHYTSVNCNFDLLWICGTSGQADRDAVWDVESCGSKELEGAMYWTEEKKRGQFLGDILGHAQTCLAVDILTVVRKG